MYVPKITRPRIFKLKIIPLYFTKGRTTLYFGSRLRAHLFLRFGEKISFWRISFDQYKGDGVL